MLCAPGAERPAEQGCSAGHAGRDRAPPGCTWPGRDLGVRAPYPGETALTWAEVLIGLREGVL